MMFASSCSKENRVVSFTPAIVVYHTYSNGESVIYLLENADDLIDYYDTNGKLVPNSRKVKGIRWVRVNLFSHDLTDNILNQDYKVLNSNAVSYPGMSNGGEATVYYAPDGYASSGGSLTIGTNSLSLQVDLPIFRKLEVNYTGEIAKYEYIGELNTDK